MILSNEFMIEAPVDRAWRLLDEVDSVILCMPGASYAGRDGDDHKVGIKVKVGAITANFQGTIRYLEKDEATRTAKIRGSGKDTGGKASANATISLRMEEDSANRTRVLVDTDLALTGKLAQFGGGIIVDIASRMVDQFSSNLHAAIAERSADGESASVNDAGAVSPDAVPAAATAREPEALDLGPVAGGVAKRLMWNLVILAVAVVLVWLGTRFLA